MYRITRRFVTLLEMLIVMTLIVLFAGVIGINIRAAYKEQKFRTELAMIVDTFRLAQDLMLIIGADVKVRFEKIEKGLAYSLEVDGAVPKEWKRVIDRFPRILEEIHVVDFRERNPLLEEESGKIQLRFFSGGTLMSRGVFRISSYRNFDAPGAKNRIICLTGHPHPIIAENKPFNYECEDKEDRNEQLTTYTMQEILEDEEIQKEKTLPAS